MSRYAQPMSQTLAEMKMNDPKLLKVFNKLKPKATVKIKHSSTLEKGKDFIEYIVKSKNTLRNGVEKITLARKDSPTSVKRFLYNRDGKVTFAVGDMAASIDDIKETLEEGYEKEVLNVLSDAGIDGYFRNGKLYVDKRDAKDAKAALEDADNIIKLPKMVKEEVELEEMKMTHVLINMQGKVQGYTSNEKDAKEMARRTKSTMHKIKKPITDKTLEKMNALAKTPKELKDLGIIEEVELDEKYDLYHKTFSDAMQHAYDYAKKKLGITVDPKEIDNKVATGPRKPSEGKTNKYRLKGKGGNLQIQVYNKGGSKPFELNMYKEENEMSDKLTDGNISLKETVLKVWQEAAKDKDEGFASDAQRKAAFASGYKEKGKKKDKEEGNEFSGALDKARKAGKKTFKVGGKEYPVEPAKKESVERYHETKQGSLRDAVLQMWGEGVKEDKKTLTKEKKNGIKKMTDTGKEVTPVETSVKMPKIKETNNKV